MSDAYIRTALGKKGWIFLHRNPISPTMRTMSFLWTKRASFLFLLFFGAIPLCHAQQVKDRRKTEKHSKKQTHIFTVVFYFNRRSSMFWKNVEVAVLVVALVNALVAGKQIYKKTSSRSVWSRAPWPLRRSSRPSAAPSWSTALPGAGCRWRTSPSASGSTSSVCTASWGRSSGGAGSWRSRTGLISRGLVVERNVVSRLMKKSTRNLLLEILYNTCDS